MDRHLSIGRVIGGETEGNNPLAPGGIRAVKPRYSDYGLSTYKDVKRLSKIGATPTAARTLQRERIDLERSIGFLVGVGPVVYIGGAAGCLVIGDRNPVDLIIRLIAKKPKTPKTLTAPPCAIVIDLIGWVVLMVIFALPPMTARR